MSLSLTPEGIKAKLLDDLCTKIHNEKTSQVSGRIKRGFLKKHLDDAKNECPGLTRDQVMNEYRRRVKKGHFNVLEQMCGSGQAIKDKTAHSAEQGKEQEEEKDSITPTVSLPRNKGGRPVGSTKERKRKFDVTLVDAANEITRQFMKEKEQASKVSSKKNGKRVVERMKKGRLDEIIEEVKKNRGLTSSTISKKMIRSRAEKGNTTVLHPPGWETPLSSIEPKLVAAIRDLRRIGKCLTVSQGLLLANSILEGTEAQKKLIEYKKRINPTASEEEVSKFGQVGEGYWRNFRKRNEL
mmetsp:Transcript_49093/g.72938  ORF Transcript_49093/g.72938 Transcript_49093/m.72938 type:complete len:297 (-) Transcript_49093:74-964(-)|eukprot:CAMPEP_0195521828 /NCGR_PEP_ID=MMETSP0794_2-20130614/19436_1 /TAXON_ID=515487 /ORGANISM="Stephanopyxis turris, Strain CCMP 815" /LENGTH=296 /DNA_ID=CAMNT_0040651451 /DNA_START=67 /DNA_END=957 /DNA_ORIENTATION=-